MTEGDHGPVVSENPNGLGPFVIVCDHASNKLPEAQGDLGVAPAALVTHIAWDPGALAVARQMSARLDAPLLWPDVSRLVIDCNRDPSAPDLIVTEGEGRPIPGNRDLNASQRSHRVETIHAPYHAAIDDCLIRRRAANLATSLIAIHSFTPVWRDKQRPWHIGLVFDEDRRLADSLLQSLKADPDLTVGVNEPYSPADRVYYTMARHRGGGALPAVMIEIRNDEIADTAAQQQWGDRLSGIFAAIGKEGSEAGHAAA